MIMIRKKIIKENRTQKTELRKFKALANKYQFLFYCIVYSIFCILTTSGCDSGNATKKLRIEIENLKDQNALLSDRIDKSDSENQQLKEQIQVLQNLPDGIKADNIYQLENVKIQNYSGIFDENEDDKIDTLVVRIQPVDTHGDLIKASGTVEIELWNLNNPDGEAQLGKWKVEPQELQNKWVDLLVTNYRLDFDITEIISEFDKPLTIKVKFTDYLSGKVFQQQKVIEP